MKRGDIIVDPDGRELRFSGYRGDRVKFYGGIYIPGEEVEEWNEEGVDDGAVPNAGEGLGGNAGEWVGADGTDSSGKRSYAQGAIERGSSDDNAAYTTNVEDGK